MNLRKCFLVNNNCYKTNNKLVVKGLMLHSTGANNPNLKRYVQPDDGLLGKNVNGNDWNQHLPGGREVCVHGFIGKLEDGTIATYQTLPWEMQGWHAGGSANSTHIGIEICEDDLKNKEYFEKVYKEATEVFAYLCKQYKLNPLTDIVSHQEGFSKGIASNHNDVGNWFPNFNKNMNDFRNDVNKLVANGQYSESNVGKPVNNNSDDNSDSSNNSNLTNYLVKINTKELNVRDGAGTDFKINTVVKQNEIYTIVEEKMNDNVKWGKLKSGAGWISLMYTVRYEGGEKVDDNSYLKNENYKGTSLVDALKEIGAESSYEYRSKLAEKNGIVGYTGSAEQNMELLDLLKKGKLVHN